MKLVVQGLNLLYLPTIVYIFELQLHKYLKMGGVTLLTIYSISSWNILLSDDYMSGKVAK